MPVSGTLTNIGGWECEIGETIAESDSTRVSRAVRSADARPVVLKHYLGEHAEALARAKREAEALADLASPHVARLLHRALGGPEPVLVLEDIEGASLDRSLGERPLDLAELLPLALQVCKGMAAIHAQGFIHGDICLANVVRNPHNGVAVLVDLDGAILVRTGAPVSELRGALAFMAPEATGRTSRGADHRSDLYGFGVLLYRLCTGTLPFEHDDPLALVHAHLAVVPAAPSERNPALPEALSAICLRLLAKDPDDRYQSARGLLADLEECQVRLARFGSVTPFELGRIDADSTFALPDRLYGRDDELRVLREELDLAVEGQLRLVCVAGSSGFGKTRLVEQLRPAVAQRGGHFASGRFDSQAVGVPHAALLGAFDDLIRQVLRKREAQQAWWRSRILEALGDLIGVIAAELPVIAGLVGACPAPPELPPLETENRFTAAFSGLLRACACAESPLVLFVDDVQRADQASLALLRSLLDLQDLSCLLLVLAYRDNEVSADHPLSAWLEARRDGERAPLKLTVGPLDQDAICALLAEGLRAEDREAPRELAELLRARSLGSPFFVHQLLRRLHREGHLAYAEGRWGWDMEAIRREQLPDDVAALLAARLQGLPEATVTVLRSAALCGTRFEAPLLAAVHDRSEAEVAEVLRPARTAGVLERLGDGWCFTHDRIVQAVLAPLDEQTARSRRLRIGRALLRDAGDPIPSETLFAAVQQLDRCLTLITDPGERLQLARLNLDAGRRAKAVTAYEAARDLLRSALGSLEGAAEPEASLRSAIVLELGQCEYLAGDHQAAEACFEEVLGELSDPMDILAVHERRIEILASRNQGWEAVQVGLEALAPLGVRLPAKESPIAVIVSLLRLRWQQRGLDIEGLAEREPCTDPQHEAAMRVLMKLTAPAFVHCPDYFPLVVLEMVRRSLRHGTTPCSSYAFAVYGLILVAGLGKVEEACRFARLAEAMIRRADPGPAAAWVEFVIGNFSLPWMQDRRPMRAYLERARQVGHRNGDFLIVAYAVNNRDWHGLYNGEPLEQLRQTVVASLPLMRATGDQPAFEIYEMLLQVLSSLTEPPDQVLPIRGEHFDEPAMVEHWQDTGSHANMGSLCVAKMMLCFLAGETALGAAEYRRTVDVLETNKAVYLYAEFHFFGTLCLLREHLDGPDRWTRRRVAATRKLFERWATLGPVNFQHRRDLLAAEQARGQGSPAEAIARYEAAIRGAAQHGWVLDEAMASELCGRCCIARGQPEQARPYLVRARLLHEAWGCRLRTRALDAEFPELGSEDDAPEPAARRASDAPVGSTLDVQAILEAANTIFSEVRKDRLLAALITNLIEAAGAERGALIVLEGEELVVGIEREHGAAGEPRLAVPLSEASRVCEAVVRYVARTGEALVLDDAASQGGFTDDPYVREHRLRSVLAGPVRHQGRLVAIVYLENGLSAGAFTPERVELLTVLSSQAAVALDNARLYAEMEERIARRTAELAQAKQQAEEASQAKSMFLASMSHEIRTPMNAVLGFAEILHGKEQDPQKKRYLRSVRSAGSSLLALIDDVLDLSRIEAGKVRLHHTAVDPRDLGAEMTSIFERKAAEKDLVLRIDVDGSVPEALVLDELRVRQVLINLLGNAVKFTEQGAVTARVSASPDGNGQRSRVELRIEVCDTGIGIPPDKLDSIFSAFEQAHRNQALTGGAGLGLSITRNLVELMDGEIDVESEPGRGTTFRVVLRDVEVAAGAPRRAPTNGVRQRWTFQPATVLIADDIDYNRDVLAGYLASLPFEFLFAENGLEVLEQVGRRRPDLILLDMRMPEMDGYEAASRLREDPELRSIPIIAISASSLKSDEPRIARFCDRYLRKPISGGELLEAMARFLPCEPSDGSAVPPARKQAAPALGREELARRLRALPSARLEALRQASTMLDTEWLERELVLLHGLDPELTEALRGKVAAFAFEELQALME
jgi:predicted ATPase/signal transduction histidine kinase/CheY-like chemotaxis protein